jgi:catechol 2,3-dioxygenase-like lactoylglutathione lyase family enzyme
MAQETARREIVKSAGPAVGKICGMNHVVLYVRDLDESIRFYRDILGLKLVRTQPGFTTNALSLSHKAEMTAGVDKNKPALVDYAVREVFFDMGNGSLFSVYEVRDVTEPDASIVSFLWPDGNDRPATRPNKLDHFAFNVETRKDMEWMREHMISNGVPVSEIVERQGANRFVSSMYFYDPSGNALEIASFDWEDSYWEGYNFNRWLRDPNPDPAVYESMFEPVEIGLPAEQ